MKKILFILYISIYIFPCLAQNKDQLLKERENTRKEIELTNRLLKETVSKKENSYEELVLLKNKIKLRNKIIRNINEEINGIDIEIKKNEEIIESLKEDLEKTKKEYASLVRKAYKMRNDNNNLMYVLAAENFNQAYKRLKYLKQFSDYRKKQIILIGELRKTIDNKNIELAQKRREKINLVNNKLAERNILIEDQHETDDLISNLSKEEEKLKDELEKKKQIAKKLNKAIEELISAAAKTGSYAKLTPEQELISKDFINNKGRFHWPTKYGIITGKFGEQPHPILKGIMIRNNGIDISTIAGSEVRALFDGEVSRVFSIKGANNTVILRHGKYITVYHNIIDVRVKVGDIVKTKDIIGTVFTDINSNSSVLHFEIWNETEKMNPQEWLSN